MPVHKYIDSHFHVLHMEKKGIDINSILNILFTEQLEYGIDIAVDAENINKRYKTAEKYPCLFLSAGFSPAHVLNKNWKKELNILEKFIKEKKTIAVGEIGLDWHWNYGTKKEQIELFENQLYFADQNKLPVIIHNRNADNEIIASLKKIKPLKGGVIHCFSSDYNFAAKLIDMGFYISFAGNLTFNNAFNLHDTAKKVPESSILLETDSPYLSPVPVRGKINTPLNIQYIYSFYSNLRNININKVKEKTLENFKRLFLKE